MGGPWPKILFVFVYSISHFAWIACIMLVFFLLLLQEDGSVHNLDLKSNYYVLVSLVENMYVLKTCKYVLYVVNCSMI